MIHLLLALSFAATPIWCMAPDEVDARLTEMQRTTPDYGARFCRIARDCVGTPYANGPLGEGPGGKYDTDPLMNLKRVDCVTYVEQVAALALASSSEQACALLQKIRYEEGEITFLKRNHFMLVDWVASNPWCKNITDELGVDTAQVTRNISKRDYFKLVKAPELGQDIADREVTVRYLPVDAVPEAMKRMPTPALVVFVGKIDWLFALHCGLYLPDESGEGRLYHASSKAGEVVAMDLAAYVAEQSERYLGVVVYRVTEPEFPAARSHATAWECGSSCTPRSDPARRGICIPTQ